jgi:hypothetical protein
MITVIARRIASAGLSPATNAGAPIPVCVQDALQVLADAVAAEDLRLDAAPDLVGQQGVDQRRRARRRRRAPGARA